MMEHAPIQSNLEKPEYDDILVFPEPGYDDIPALFFIPSLSKNFQK